MAGPRVGRRGLLVGAALAAVSPAFASRAQASGLGADQWQADLDALIHGLKTTHRDPDHLTPAAELDAAAAAVRARLPDMRDFEAVAAFQGLVAMIGDGHTFLVVREHFRPYPFAALWLEEGVYVTLAEDADLLGLRITAIDGMPIEEVGARLDRVIPQGENRWYVAHHRAERLRWAELLAALGVCRDPGGMDITGVDARGERRTMRLDALAIGASTDRLAHQAWPNSPRVPEGGLGWSRLAEGRVLYANFRSYADLPTTAASLIAEAERDPPQGLIVDLRENGGGNYTLPRAHLIDHLQGMGLNRPDRLHVLIGRGVFSAAMVTATDFRRETEATLIGEPTGARPGGFQELSTFTLPHSGLRVGCAIRRYRFGAESEDAVHPDIRVDPRWASIAEGRDEALEKALSLIATART